MFYVCSNLFLFHEICAWNIMQVYAYLCKENVYLFNIMINRKLCGIFEVFLHSLRKRPIFLLFVFSIFSSVLIFRNQTKQKRKSLIFSVFAWKRPFLSQIKRWLSVIYRYIGQTTPHPPRFWHSQGGSALFRKFFIFFIFIFCKILWFCLFRFSTEFW